MVEALKTETKANCALALASRLLIFMAQRGLITIDDAAKIAHDAGDLAEQTVDGGVEAQMLMDELVIALGGLRR
jgi:hypothetical protein